MADQLRVSELSTRIAQERDLAWRAHIGKRPHEAALHARVLAKLAAEFAEALAVDEAAT